MSPRSTRSLALTKTAAGEVARQGIRVNAVCPGPIETPMLARIADVARLATLDNTAGSTPMGRNGQPEEVARVVAWLCTDAASYVTGVAMPVDGGYEA